METLTDLWSRPISTLSAFTLFEKLHEQSLESLDNLKFSPELGTILYVSRKIGIRTFGSQGIFSP